MVFWPAKNRSGSGWTEVCVGGDVKHYYYYSDSDSDDDDYYYYYYYWTEVTTNTPDHN